MLQYWAVQTESSRHRPVWPLWQLSHTPSLLLLVLLLLLMQVEGDEKKAKTSARATRRHSAAATAATSITVDELGEFERRVDIVASFLVLNHEARSFDDTVPKLMLWTAALYGGLGGLEKAYKNVMNSVEYANKKLVEGLESACWELDGAGAAADSASPAAQLPAPPGQCRRQHRHRHACRRK